MPYDLEAELVLVVLTNTGGKAAALEQRIASIVLTGEPGYDADR